MIQSAACKFSYKKEINVTNTQMNKSVNGLTAAWQNIENHASALKGLQEKENIMRVRYR